MIADQYRAQVALLLRVLPTVAEQKCFALHGGTAINLFLLDLPRLSVDIDLTYLPIEGRDETLAGINAALQAIKEKLESLHPDLSITTRNQEGSDVKLYVNAEDANIKIEVNTIKRGTLSSPTLTPISDAVQDEYGVFAAMNIVPEDELWGGKICAALDRQHPRDLFDMANFFESGHTLSEVRDGFLLAFLGHNRPFHEVLAPSKIDQSAAYERQFVGMTAGPFSYDDFETTRDKLFSDITSILKDKDKSFLISFNEGEPDWNDYEQYQNFPSIKWKLLNIQKFKKQNPDRHKEQSERLETLLSD
ncbi:MAG: nucleotidyl transferase AbiEii/AbiGii toxin family protein [Sneathiella sp.]